MASAVVVMLTGSSMPALDRRTIVMGICRQRRRAALRLMLCRAYGAAARSDMAAANQEFTAAVRDARRAHKLEHTCARYCRMSPGLYVMHKSLERLAAVPRSQGIPSLHHPETPTLRLGGIMHHRCSQGGRAVGVYSCNRMGA